MTAAAARKAISAY